MRTLGFRAMWEDLNDSEGDTWCDTDQIELSEFFQLLEDGKLNKETLGQKTGLKDKNGVEIYEGDLVMWGHLEGWSHELETRIGEVKYNPDLQFDVKNIKHPHVFHFGSFAYTETDKYLEVIGNIYENPELLEVNDGKA